MKPKDESAITSWQQVGLWTSLPLPLTTQVRVIPKPVFVRDLIALKTCKLQQSLLAVEITTDFTCGRKIGWPPGVKSPECARASRNMCFVSCRHWPVNLPTSGVFHDNVQITLKGKSNAIVESNLRRSSRVCLSSLTILLKTFSIHHVFHQLGPYECLLVDQVTIHLRSVCFVTPFADAFVQ